MFHIFSDCERKGNREEISKEIRNTKKIQVGEEVGESERVHSEKSNSRIFTTLIYHCAANAPQDLMLYQLLLVVVSISILITVEKFSQQQYIGHRREVCSTVED